MLLRIQFNFKLHVVHDNFLKNYFQRVPPAVSVFLVFFGRPSFSHDGSALLSPVTLWTSHSTNTTTTTIFPSKNVHVREV